VIRTDCRLCGSLQLHTYLDLGYTALADAFLTPDQLTLPEVTYPLRVNLCLDCGFSQLGEEVAPETLYQNSYPYESSITATGREHYRLMAQEIVTNYDVASGSQVIDIGSNVGVLLSGFEDAGMKVLGVDPATEIAARATARGIPTLPLFFGTDSVAAIQENADKAGVITGTNVFAHIPNLDDFMSAVSTLLAEDGVLVIEAPSLKELIEHCEYDTIYHEHLSYLAVKPLQGFFARHQFEIIDVQELSIHGGTIRLVISRNGQHPVNPRVGAMIEQEQSLGLFNKKRLTQFSSQVANHRNQLFSLLWKLKSEGKTIAAVSAPAKGNTLLNYCGIDHTLIDFVTEKSELKKGRYTPGSHIPVVGDEELLTQQPDYALILAWNFKDEIMANLAEFKLRGGQFIIPIPEPTII